VATRQNTLIGRHPWLVAAIVSASLCAACGTASAQRAETRSAESIVRDFELVRTAAPEHGSAAAEEPEIASIEEACRLEGEYARELLATDPLHPALPSLMRVCWAGMNEYLGESRQVIREAVDLLGSQPTIELSRAAYAAMSRAAILADDITLAERRLMVRRGATRARGDELAGAQLLELARLYATSPPEARELAMRVEREFADAAWLVARAAEWRQQLSRVGSRHRELFTDPGGVLFDSDAAAGPRIIHYWSPVVAECERELAAVADLLARHAASGLVVAGIHAGTPPAESGPLLAWLAAREANWPQRIDLAATDGTASGAGTTPVAPPAIPFALLIDPEGRIRMVSQRVEALEPMLEELLAPPAAAATPQ